MLLTEDAGCRQERRFAETPLFLAIRSAYNLPTSNLEILNGFTQLQAGGDMYRRCLIPIFFLILLVGCATHSPEKTAQEPNVTFEGVRISQDVVYGHKFGMALTFDMYQPENPNGAGVIGINSGGWQSPVASFHMKTSEGLRLATLEELETNTIETPTGETMIVNMRSFNPEPLFSRGFTVFDVRHGSSPKFKMDEIVADLRRAVRFIRFHAWEYGVDAERLGLWGASAGGHLSLLLATTADIGNPDTADEFEKDTGRVAAVVAYFPPSDLKKNVEAGLKNNPDFLKLFPALDLGIDEYRKYSPINFVSSDDPPILIVHGDEDLLVSIDQGKAMCQALQEAGVESKFVAILGAGHGFEGADADHALAEATDWFMKHLVGK